MATLLIIGQLFVVPGSATLEVASIVVLTAVSLYYELLILAVVLRGFVQATPGERQQYGLGLMLVAVAIAALANVAAVLGGASDMSTTISVVSSIAVAAVPITFAIVAIQARGRVVSGEVPA
jgi:hypothetical protein